jgi:hypothetical protein
MACAVLMRIFSCWQEVPKSGHLLLAAEALVRWHVGAGVLGLHGVLHKALLRLARRQAAGGSAVVVVCEQGVPALSKVTLQQFTCRNKRQEVRPNSAGHGLGGSTLNVSWQGIAELGCVGCRCSAQRLHVCTVSCRTLECVCTANVLD